MVAAVAYGGYPNAYGSALWETLGVTKGGKTPEQLAAEVAARSKPKSLPSGLYQASGGYVYQWNASTGEIRIRYSPSAGKGSWVVASGSTAHAAILNELIRIGAPNASEATLSGLPSKRNTSSAPSAPSAGAAPRKGVSALTELVRAIAGVTASRNQATIPTTSPYIPPSNMNMSSDYETGAVSESSSGISPWIIGGAAAGLGLLTLVLVLGGRRSP